MAKGSGAVPATPAKSSGASNERSSTDGAGAHVSTGTERSVSFEDSEDGSEAKDEDFDYEDKTPAPGTSAETPETATLSSGLSGGTRSLSRNLADELADVAGPEPDYDDYDDGNGGSKPSLASEKRAALLNAFRPPINGDTPGAKQVFERIVVLMKTDDWMQLFSPKPKRQADWPALLAFQAW